MGRAGECRAPVFAFVIAWAMLAHASPFHEYAFGLAFVLALVAWGVVQVAGRAITRQGWRGAWRLAQAVACSAAWVVAMPEALAVKALLLWGVGLPMLLAGAGAAALRHRYVALRRLGFVALGVIATVLMAIGTVVGLLQGGVTVAGLVNGAGTSLLYVGCFVYGLLLAGPMPESDVQADARFGSAEQFGAAGMSREE